jgi:mRNA-degrading endonuclease RelE of RelBE toxin-antitoxin system
LVLGVISRHIPYARHAFRPPDFLISACCGFDITITDDADAQLRALPVREQRILEAAIEARLRDRPDGPTKAIRRLRPNPLAEFELRVRDLRVLHNVERDLSAETLCCEKRRPELTDAGDWD